MPHIRIENPHPPDQNRHLRRGQRQQMRSINEQLFRPTILGIAEVVAKAVGGRFEYCKGIDIGHLLGRIGSARCKRHRNVVPCIAGSRFDTDTARQNDEVRQGDPDVARLRFHVADR